MKPFNLEQAKAGKPICTRDGQKVRIICWDRKDIKQIVALLECSDGVELLHSYYTTGLYYNDGYESGVDLMMATEKHEGWIIVCKGHDRWASDVIYDTKEEAEKAGKEYPYYVTTAKIEWEE